MRYTVDRIVENTAVLEGENKDFINVSLKELPEGIRDGSVLVYKDGVFEADAEYEMQRRKAMLEKQQRLLNRKK